MAAFALFPLTHVAVPWYALLADGSWVELAICYCGVMGEALVIAAGMCIKARACLVIMVLPRPMMHLVKQAVRE